MGEGGSRKAERVEKQEDAGQGGSNGCGGNRTGQTPQGETQGQQRVKTEEKGLKAGRDLSNEDGFRQGK